MNDLKSFIRTRKTYSFFNKRKNLHKNFKKYSFFSLNKQFFGINFLKTIIWTLKFSVHKTRMYSFTINYIKFEWTKIWKCVSCNQTTSKNLAFYFSYNISFEFHNFKEKVKKIIESRAPRTLHIVLFDVVPGLKLQLNKSNNYFTMHMITDS